MMLLIAKDESISKTGIISKLAIKHNLETEGFNVKVCNSGVEALEIIKKKEIRIVITDYEIPDMDGLSLCREIRKLDSIKRIYIIMMITKEEKRDIAEVFKSGADDCITKPFEREELISRVNVGARMIDLEDMLLQSQKEVIKLAKEDPLTNLLNRRAFLDEALDELDRAARGGYLVSTIMIDIDDLKKINERYGHQVGDNVLIEVARRLQSSCRPYDSLGRYGGEEFLALLPNTRTSNAVKIAKRMRSVITEKSFDIKNISLRITASFGISVLAPDIGLKDSQIDDLIKRTDLALYKAKREGKDRIAVNIES